MMDHWSKIPSCPFISRYDNVKIGKNDNVKIGKQNDRKRKKGQTSEIFGKTNVYSVSVPKLTMQCGLKSALLYQNWTHPFDI